MFPLINSIKLRQDLERFIEEDMPYGDITTDSIFIEDSQGKGQLIAKESGVICGLNLFEEVFKIVDSKRPVDVEHYYQDGDYVEAFTVLSTFSGSVSTILKGERLALNLMQRLSGIATMSRQYSEAIKDYHTVVVDTRKTTPGLRHLEKYAVRCGGGQNHRYSLSDAVMIKDNHIAGAGGIKEAVQKVKAIIPHTTKVEVEVETIEELMLAIEADVDIIMLDNMDDETTTECVKRIKESHKPQIIIEASGNMTLERLESVAKCGVDVISVGALTHGVQSMDISLKFRK